MTPQEFKAWFDGFTEAFTGVPTKAQWARVKERVGEIDGKPVTERIYVDRYLPNYFRVPSPYWWPGYLTTCGTAAGNGTNAVGSNAGAANARYQNAVRSFNSTDAMAALGRSDAAALA